VLSLFPLLPGRANRSDALVLLPLHVSAFDSFSWSVPPDGQLGNSQDRIDQGTLIRWTKGFGAANTEGQDVAEMFRESLRKKVSLLTLM